MPPATIGETFAVVPIGDQAGSLEWAQYADLVAQQLTGRGYVRVTKPADAKYAVLFSYAIDRGKTTTTAVPVFGQTGRWRDDVLLGLRLGFRLYPTDIWGSWLRPDHDDHFHASP